MGRRRSPRRASTEAAPERRASPWWSRAALLSLALGLVLMHHLVGAHQHASATPAAASSMVPGPSMMLGPSMVPGSIADHPAHGDGETMRPDAVPVEVAVASSEPVLGHAGAAAVHRGTDGSTALLHEHHESDDHSAVTMLLHMCLAVLAAAALVVLALVWWWRTLLAAGRAVHRVVTVVPRAPPVPARLARLQVLRL